MRFCSKPPALSNTHACNQRLVQQSDHVRYDHTFNEIATSQISCLTDVFTSKTPDVYLFIYISYETTSKSINIENWFDICSFGKKKNTKVSMVDLYG